MIPRNSHTGRQRDCVLFGNRHIKVLAWVLFGETYHARAFTHGWGNRHQLGILRRHITQKIAKDFRKGGLSIAAFGQAVVAWIKLRHAVIANRIFFRRRIAFAFFGHHVEELWPF
ncbi:Uncharacterised protein [Vibrio cholerae]|nr:Uncharacterised protein [Vibrio cholerae]CSB92850.1 Uncharacterised protein [Vibrio cholerae]CSC00604.1 Uncharacterised protein [Vibrio cholerae]